MAFSTSETSGEGHSVATAVVSRRGLGMQRVGGVAAAYLALALTAAIPYFLLVVDYPSADTAAEKVDLIVDHYPSMYTVYLATYVAFGLAVGVLALALWERLDRTAPLPVLRLATLAGFLWSFALVSSGLVFTYGMTTVHDLAATDHASAAVAWQAIEPVALALGGAGGELLGGLWVLLVSVAILKASVLPKGVGWLGVVIGAIGLASTVPPLHDATVAFGLLEIIWLGWLGGVLLATKASTAPGRTTPAGR